jgi:hypothetical protein
MARYMYSVEPSGTPHALIARATEDALLTAAFVPRGSGWLGGDSSTSLRLDDSSHLWLFADTLWGSLDGGGRRLDAMPHNTVALVADSVYPPEPRFFARRTEGLGLDPRGFFAPSSGGDDIFYWLVAGTRLSCGRVLVLAQVQGADGLDDFRGSDAILVDASEAAEPLRWQYATSRIAQTDKRHSWNEGVYAAPDGFVYIVGMRENGEWAQGRTQHLSRIDEDSLREFDWQALRFWGGGDIGWSDDASRAATLYEAPYTEGTLMHHPMGFYYVVGCQAYQRQVMLHTASNLTGPWSKVVAYTLPPLSGERVAYAAKSHPELAAEDEIVFTYNVNSGEEDVAANLELYHPRFVRLKLAPPDGGKRDEL